MLRILLLGLFGLVVLSCKKDLSAHENKLLSSSKEKKQRRIFSSVAITNLWEKDSMSIRGLEVHGDANLFYASNLGFGSITIKKDTVISFDFYNEFLKNTAIEKQSAFRSLALNVDTLYALSIGNPALLFKADLVTKDVEIKYNEFHENVFYDSMRFWNAKEGIAIGDPTAGCLSIIITRDGGNTWDKIPCKNLPNTVEGEAAFAASDTNISIVGDHAWIVSGGTKSRVFHTPDKGFTWEVVATPLEQGAVTQGGYSIDFYDENNGFIIGGDYTKPELNRGNKAITKDGGKTWELIADGQEPDYRSCVQYVPNGIGNALVAVGFRGISYSHDHGNTWKKLSDESFFTIRFLNDSIAYAAGSGRIAKLVFK